MTVQAHGFSFKKVDFALISGDVRGVMSVVSGGQVRAMPVAFDSGEAMAAVARAREAASNLEAALAELCRLGLHVGVRVEPGFDEGSTAPSVFFVEVEVE